MPYIRLLLARLMMLLLGQHKGLQLLLEALLLGRQLLQARLLL